ncbi:MAG: hypothetical protein SLAVMIC_00189 [uncultured marine phage]|uniref:Uncharacterized protein n=1 Tax=uncultured marine phage TaxID=707152 RepID=A0A8D9CB62_9VIRU|nr:MAG: hypothetical protein SLAVMIC_00189 [uncultured marine phage]
MEVVVFKINYPKEMDYCRTRRVDFLSEGALTLIDFIPREESLVKGGVWGVDEDNKTIHVLVKWVKHQTNHPNKEILESKEGKFYTNMCNDIKSSIREKRLSNLLD